MNTDVDSESTSIDNKEDSRRTKIKAELSEMSFEELQALKNKVGSKVYNQTVLQSGKKSYRKDFKRANKNRPREVSAKIPVSARKEVIVVKKHIQRDPRFDDLSGEFNPSIFEKTYSFLDDVKDKEKRLLKKKLLKEKDDEKKGKIKMLINRMENQEREKKKKMEQQEKMKAHKKEELELIKEGKKPFFVKKSVRKKQELAEKFQQLKKSGKLQKYMERKRKKNARIDKKKFPIQS